MMLFARTTAAFCPSTGEAERFVPTMMVSSVFVVVDHERRVPGQLSVVAQDAGGELGDPEPVPDAVRLALGDRGLDAVHAQLLRLRIEQAAGRPAP